MIISRIAGGLGNQLFQYGFGLYLSKKNECEYYLYIDNRYEETSSTQRTFNLNDFQFKIGFASESNIKKLVPYIENINLYRLIRKCKVKYPFLPFNKNHLVESNYYFDERYVENRDTNLFLDGYWQSYKYVDEVRNILIRQFVLNEKFNIESNFFYNKIINSPNSVSIHVRRGDYISNKSNQEKYGTCDMDYYRLAIKRIEALKGEKTVYFIFSDDIDWVKDNFKQLREVVFVSSSNPSVDLKLMSMCNSNIIANSTFSWWGAYLNQNKSKIVIHPKQWLKDENENKKMKLLFPPDWIAI
jgi:hypothetical protein